MISKVGSHVRHNVVAYLALFVALGGTSAYAANTVFSTDIVDGEVKTPDLASEAVTARKIGLGAVTRDKLAQASVIAEKINNGAVNSDKVRNAAITPSKLGTLPAVRVAAFNPQATANLSGHSVRFDFEDFDTAGAFDSSQNAVCLKPPTDGTYVLSGDVAWQANTTGYRSAEITRDHPHPVAGFTDKVIGKVGGPALSPPALTI